MRKIARIEFFEIFFFISKLSFGYLIVICKKRVSFTSICQLLINKKLALKYFFDKVYFLINIKNNNNNINHKTQIIKIDYCIVL
jgi:hypothetical protein